VVDEENKVLSHLKSIKFKNEVVSFEDSEFIQLIGALTSTGDDYVSLVFKGEAGYAFINPFSDTNLKLISFIPQKDIQFFTEQNLIISYTIILLATLLIIILLIFVRKLVVRPIRELKEELSELDFNEDFSDRINYVEENEFTSLVNSINSMLNRAQEAVKQKQSYENELNAMNEELSENNKTLEERNDELHDEKELLHALINNLTIGVTIWSSKGEMMICNDEFTLLTGYDKTDVPNSIKWFELALPDTEYRKSVWKDWQGVVREQKTIMVCYKITCKDGSKKDIELRISFLRDKSFVVSMTDMTHRLMMEKELVESEKRANEANVAKSEFLANMSHELRTPLNGIIGFSEVLNNTKLSRDQIEYIGYINYSGKKLLNIISDILDFSKIEAGKLDLEDAETDIYKIAENCIKVVAPVAAKNGITLFSEIDQNIPPVYTDSLRLYQVIGNLMSNAVKFTTDGSVKLKIKILEKSDDRMKLKFSVKDTGIGLKSEEIEKIFSSFTQADSTVTRKFGGTGLGLTISNSILTMMGSTIQVESIYGTGSEFSFTVEYEIVKEVEENKSSGEMPIHEEKTNALNKGTLLIAEDDQINQKLIKLMIKKQFPNIKLLSAEDGKEAYDIYVQKKPDIIIMDLQMPKMNGFELTEKIRAEEKHEKKKRVPIIAFTADATQNAIKKCYESGMDDYVIKPTETENLIQKIEKYIF
jgi:PAS domain S-box-containing protein